MNKQILHIVKSYLNSHENIPPLIVGIQKKPLVLISSFRDFQEQITFCSIVKIAFSLHNIQEYHVLTHGLMKDKLNKDQITKAKSHLMSFLKQEKNTYIDINNAEIIIDTKIGKTKECTVFKVVRDVDQNFTELIEVLKFNSTSLIEGMFTGLLSVEKINLPANVIDHVKKQVQKITYQVPDIINPVNLIETPVSKKLKKLWEM